MAVSGEFTAKEGKITVTNGDLAALTKIAADYKLADITSVITFAIEYSIEQKGKRLASSKTMGQPLNMYRPTICVRKRHDIWQQTNRRKDKGSARRRV
jgi:hypothetical protein